jgi:ribosome-associated translation inhibitor RaiA
MSLPQIKHAPQIDVFAKDFPLSDALQSRVNEKVGKVMEKLAQDSISTHVVLKLVRFPLEGNFIFTSEKRF